MYCLSSWAAAALHFALQVSTPAELPICGLHECEWHALVCVSAASPPSWLESGIGKITLMSRVVWKAGATVVGVVLVVANSILEAKGLVGGASVLYATVGNSSASKFCI